MFPAVDDTHPAAASTYSPLAEIETGAVTVGKGLNQISFKRVDSYNIILKSFVIVFVPQEHAEHTFPTEWTVEKAETCTTDGLESRKCSVCGIKEERVVKAAHKWGAATPVAADTDKGYMAYNKYECSACHKIKYEFAAKEAKDAVTNNKTSNPPTPDPYIKLKSNGKTFSIKFNAEKLLDGELYQEGIFDQWPTNGKKFGYFSHTGNVNDSDATKAAAAKAAEETGNFEVSVNGQPIDLSQYKGGGNDSATFNFFGWSGDETSQTFTGDNTAWSKDILCPVGHMSIEKGEAEIVYKRVESYNLAVKNIILVVNEYDHEHTKADTLSSDEEGHWYACSDAQCPLKGIKLEYAKHTLEADTSKTDVEATCSKEGTHYVKCSVCEKELAQKVDKLPHTWVDDESKTDVPATCAAEGKHYVKCSKCDATDEQPIAKSAHNWGEPGTKINGATPYTCTVCSAKCYVLEFTDANSDGIHAAGKFSSGSASWNITGIDAGSYELYAYACTKGTSMGTQFGSRYYWNVDSGAKIEANSGTYEDYGFGTGEGTDYQWTKKSAATITITDTSALFKMSFQSSGYSAYFSALRLVKVA